MDYIRIALLVIALYRPVMSTKSNQYQIRFTDQQRELWTEAAAIDDRTFADWIRRTLDREALRLIKERDVKADHDSQDAKKRGGK